MEYRRLALKAVVLLSLLYFVPSGIADTREERVRKFQTSLGEQVVRDSRARLPEDEKRTVLLRTVVAVGAGICVLAAVSILLSRLRARRSEREAELKYLTETLQTPAAVKNHLERVAAAHTPLFLRIDDHFLKFSTLADGLSPGEEDAVRVHPLSPAAGNEMLRKSKRVRVEYLHEKVPYHFDTSWSGEQGVGGGFLHLLSLPDHIVFTQRREHFRVEPGLDDPLLCRFPDRNFPPMNVLDLGMGGFALAASVRMRPGEEIEGCRIDGGGMLPLELSARCVYEFPFPEGKSAHRFRYGFTVTHFAEGNGKRLSHYIAKRQLTDLSRRKAMES